MQFECSAFLKAERKKEIPEEQEFEFKYLNEQ